MCVGSLWKRVRRNREKQIKSFPEGSTTTTWDGTGVCAALGAQRSSPGSERCCEAFCKMSHISSLVCLHSDPSLVLKTSRH